MRVMHARVNGQELEERTKNNVNWVTSIPIAIPMATMVLTSQQTNYRKAVNVTKFSRSK